MSRFVRFICFIFFVLVLYKGEVFGLDIINLDTVKKRTSEIKTYFSKTGHKLTSIKFQKFVSPLRNDKCEWFSSGNNMVIRPICFLKSEFPLMDWKESVDIVLNKVEDVKNGYNLLENEFEYQGVGLSQLLDLTQRDRLFSDDRERALLFAIYQKRKRWLIVPKIYFAFNQSRDYEYFVVKRDASKLGPCSKKNYLIALSMLNKTFIKKGQTYNLNEKLAQTESYCRGSTNQDLMFNGGVCGAATQLFRLSLIMPDLSALDRQAHSQRYTRYYDEYIFGDDAAVYEMKKKLTVKNDSKGDIYLRVLNKEPYHILIGTTPIKSNKKVVITKNQTGPLKAELKKTVIDNISKKILSVVERSSRYAKKNRDSN